MSVIKSGIIVMTSFHFDASFLGFNIFVGGCWIREALIHCYFESMDVIIHTSKFDVYSYDV